MKNFVRLLRRRLLPNWTDEWNDIRKTLPGQKVLHLGCGTDRFGDIVRLDINPGVEPDILWDLTQFPYPIADASFDLIVAFNIVEHIPPFFDLFGELHRILRPGGRIIVLCPHFSNAAAFIDPTHVKYLSARSFDYFCAGTDFEKEYGFYVDYRFTVNRKIISLSGIWQAVPGLSAAISKSPNLWENHLCYLMRGRGIYIDLRKA